MKLTTIIIGLLFIPTFLFSSPNKLKIEWCEGKVVLANGKSIEGEVFYDYYNDVLAVKEGKLIKAYTARRVDEFYFYDKKMNTHRYFKSYDFKDSFRYARTSFFEVLILGDVSLIRQKKRNANFKLIRARDQKEYSIKYNKLFDYWVMMDGRFISSDAFRKHAFPILEDNYDLELDDKVDPEHTSLTLMSNMIVMVEYFSKLPEEKRKVGYFKRSAATASAL